MGLLGRLLRTFTRTLSAMVTVWLIAWLYPLYQTENYYSLLGLLYLGIMYFSLVAFAAVYSATDKLSVLSLKIRMED